jgi:transcriptional regulator with GAF, ATPase, and Fis domain
MENEARLRHADGQYRWSLIRNVPLRDELGNIVKWYGTSIDIEDRKQAEDALRQSQAYLSEAQRLSHTGSFGWKVCTGDILWSAETFRIFEYDRTTKPTLELAFQRAHPEDALIAKQTVARASQDGKNFDFEYRLLMPDGSLKYVHVVARGERDESGELKFLGAVMDVTAAKQSQQALEQAFHEIKTLKDQLQSENIVLREEIDRASMFEEIVGTSAALKTVLSRLSKVAPTDSSVLLTGETGTGKELVARAIHRRSQRSSRAFVSVNCAAIPRDLIASELFGHEKGAFTGATQRRLGRFELAEGGTIFLDEIGELPAETQIALLRVLQEHEFERVGGAGSLRTDVRVIAATNRDLEAAIAAGAFRSDLFYRLNVFPIEMPPLRERREDIPLLVEYFINRYGRKAGKSFQAVNKRSLDLLQAYTWPGNIRELQNVIERSVIVCETENFLVDGSWLSRQPLATEPNRRFDLSKKLPSEEKEIIEAALNESGGRVYGPAGAAAKLGMPRSTLESKIRSLKIDKNRFKAAEPF